MLAATFAGVAALLAAVGLFDVTAYATQQRLRDFGVRRALGATTGHIVTLVAGSALRIAIGGAVVGLVLAVVLGRAIEGLLFGVPPHDLASTGFVLIVLAVVVISATVIPALRAARVDPAVALRGE